VTLTIGQGALSPRIASRDQRSADVDPLPLVLLRRGAVSPRALGTLHTDPRFELLVTDELTAEWCALAHRVAGLLVVSEGDPLDGLVYALTAQVRAPIVIAMSRRYQVDCRDLMDAGAVACMTLPITKTDLDTLLPTLREHAGLARIDPTLRLLLDPIARVARYQDRVVRLSQREFSLLHYLSSRHGRPVAADELMTHVWGDGDVTQRTRQILDVYIHQLRKRLDSIGLKGAIATVRMFGYALVQVTAEDGAAPVASSGSSRRR
jgi:DNA-binding response OmpR family regulator